MLYGPRSRPFAPYLGTDHVRQSAQRAVDVLRLPSTLADGLKIARFGPFRGPKRPFSPLFRPLWVRFHLPASGTRSSLGQEGLFHGITWPRMAVDM